MSIYVLIIGFRNLTEVNASYLEWNYVIFGLVCPLSLVLLSEVLVDWLKHAFITKFNHIHPDVYLRFIETLSRDFEAETLADQSPAVSRRIGFSSFPLTCLLIRIFTQITTVSQFNLLRHGLTLLVIYVLLLVFKIILGISLALYTRQNNSNQHHNQHAVIVKNDPENSVSVIGLKEKSRSDDPLLKTQVY